MSHAKVVITGTRVIYPAGQKEVTVQLTNKGKAPSLVQLWIDDGKQLGAGKAKTPFILTPPLARIEPDAGQAVRILQDGTPLPADKETLFWLNMLDVGPKGTGDGNQLNIAITTRIKLIYRPKGLSGNAMTAHESLQWSMSADNGTPALKVHNPTPYYVSFSKIGIKTSTGETIYRQKTGMVAPGEDATFDISELKGKSFNATDVAYEVISDLGARMPNAKPLKP